MACSEAFNCSKGGQGRAEQGRPPRTLARVPRCSARCPIRRPLTPRRQWAGAATDCGCRPPRALRAAHAPPAHPSPVSSPGRAGCGAASTISAGAGRGRERGRVLPERLLRLQHRGTGQRPAGGGSAALSGGRGRAVRCGAVREAGGTPAGLAPGLGGCRMLLKLAVTLQVLSLLASRAHGFPKPAGRGKPPREPVVSEMRKVLRGIGGGKQKLSPRLAKGG